MQHSAHPVVKYCTEGLPVEALDENKPLMFQLRVFGEPILIDVQGFTTARQGRCGSDLMTVLTQGLCWLGCFIGLDRVGGNIAQLAWDKSSNRLLVMFEDPEGVGLCVVVK